MNKIINENKIDENTIITIEERLSKNGDIYYCTCLNNNCSTIILSFNTDLYYKILKGVK